MLWPPVQANDHYRGCGCLFLIIMAGALLAYLGVFTLFGWEVLVGMFLLSLLGMFFLLAIGSEN